MHTPDDWNGDENHIAYSQRRIWKTISKSKVAAVPAYPIYLKKTSNDNNKKLVPLRITILEDIHLKEKEFSSLVNQSSLEKIKDGKRKESFVPLRNEVDGTKDALQLKLPTDLFRPIKKRNCSYKGSSKKLRMFQDFIDQQRAYYKEIDEYELEVEEAEE